MFMFDAFSHLDQIHNEINQIFNRRTPYLSSSKSFPLLNLYDHPEYVQVIAEVPGLAREDLDIQYTDGILAVSGQRADFIKKEQNSVALRQERPSGTFTRKLKIPVEVQADKISAKLHEGLLSITLPKAEEAKPKKIKIELH